MRTIVNTEQAEAWNGYEGRHWADHADRYDAVNAGFNGPLFDAAAIGERDRVLDVGCGTGQTTRMAARLASGGSVEGVDLSAPMLARARATTAAEGLGNVTFTQADAQVHPFPREAFDVVISRAAIMFFRDPVAAFANIVSALRPRGRLVFVALGDLSRTSLGRAFAVAAGKHAPDRYAEPGAPGPGSLADPAHVSEVLAAAGFANVWTAPIEVPMRSGADAVDAAEFILGWGPIRHFLRDVTEDEISAVHEALLTELEEHETSEGVHLTGAALVVKGERT